MKKYKMALSIAIVAIIFQQIHQAETPLFAAERDAVIPFDGCTGFVVEGNLLVTAKHCQHPGTVTVKLQNRTVAAHKVFSTSEEDGPVVFLLEGGPYISLKLASEPPRVGEAVYSLGYPGGHWARIEGEITGGNGLDLNYTNHRIATGNSGGPLLNEQGEVIGIALHVDADLSVHRSGFAGWKVTREAVLQAKKSRSNQQDMTVRGSVVVVFSTDNCLPCEQLKQDVRAGYFDSYNFRFVKWDRQSKRWSEPELYQEFWKMADPKMDHLTFPTIWIRGTDKYRVGYTRTGRRGLLGWLSAIFRHLWKGLVGERERRSLELPPSPPSPGEEKLPNEPEEELNAEEREPPPNDSALQRVLHDLNALREQTTQTKQDLETFKQSGLLGKVKAIAILKSDQKKTLEQVSKVKSDLKAIRTEFHGQPVQFLWGLFGLLTGLAQKRFLD